MALIVEVLFVEYRIVFTKGPKLVAIETFIFTGYLSYLTSIVVSKQYCQIFDFSCYMFADVFGFFQL